MKRIPLAELILLGILILFTIKPVENYDVWFHLKYGEYILQTKTLPFTDQFSHTAFGHPAVPYEWLFQVALFVIYTHLGTVGIQALVVALVLVYVWLFRLILIEIFNIPLLPRLALTAGVYIINYDFWVERPQSAAYAFFMTILFLVLNRVFGGKRHLLWLSIPLFYVWTNTHASMILGVYLFASYTAVTALRWIIWRKQSDRLLTLDLFFWGALAFATTILPPLGTKVYQLLILFYQKRLFIMQVIEEWQVLSVLTTRYYLYLSLMGIAFVAFVAGSVRGRRWSDTLMFLPLLPLGAFVLTGVRQTAFAAPAIFFLFVPLISSMKFQLTSRVRTSLTWGIAALILVSTVVALWFYRKEVTSVNRGYPSREALSFIATNMSGNMYNELETGGYLLYHLGPKIKTFIDGRTDMFLPEVMPDQAKLLAPKYANDTALLSYFRQLTTKYHISWAIFTRRVGSRQWRLAQALSHEHEWVLVYRDTTCVIFVRKDGLNDAVIETFGQTNSTITQ